MPWRSVASQGSIPREMGLAENYTHRLRAEVCKKGEWAIITQTGLELKCVRTRGVGHYASGNWGQFHRPHDRADPLRMFSARAVKSMSSDSGFASSPGNRGLAKITHIGLEPKCVKDQERDGSHKWAPQAWEASEQMSRVVTYAIRPVTSQDPPGKWDLAKITHIGLEPKCVKEIKGRRWIRGCVWG